MTIGPVTNGSGVPVSSAGTGGADMPLRIVVVSGGLSQPSSTRLLADRLAHAVGRELGLQGISAEFRSVDLRDIAQDITNHLLTGFPSPPLAQTLTAVREADAVIAVSPVFSASYSGLFKSFFDILDTDALDGTPVIVGATGGSARHSLALEYALRPLMAYLRARMMPTAVFAATADFGNDDSAATLADRIDRAAGELALTLTGTASGTQNRRRAEGADPFAAPMSFEQLLAAHTGDDLSG